MFQQTSLKLSNIKFMRTHSAKLQLLQVDRRSQDRAVGIVTGYGLDDRGVGV
jgi:hypothetical protein